MRLSELVLESDVAHDIEGALDSLLMSVRANDISSIATDKIVDQLRQQGYSVSTSSLINFIEGNPLVQNATVDNITFKHADNYAVSGDAESAEKNKEKVHSMAKKAAMKGIKQ
jgi:hypothetical protein